MKRLNLSQLAFTAVFLLSHGAVHAQSFRCKADLVNVGDSRATALQKCGEPLLKDSFCTPLDPQTAEGLPLAFTRRNVVACIPVDEWTYNPGYGQFMTTLRFEEGTLKAIKYGDRVK